ncbi:hypothetical protein [Conexibacter sp. DBS9H8]|nr:hypothetical protein [Conexibacter sp. DBS9H8]
MLSPAPIALNRDALMVAEHVDTTVALEAHQASSDLRRARLDKEQDAEAS